MDPSFKECRRAIELIDSILRRAPLSPSQKERLERASREMKRAARLPKGKARMHIFSTVAVVAKVVLELIDESRNDRNQPPDGIGH